MIRLSGKAITKRYGATRALDGLDLDIASGEIVGIAGPNGAGKSTLTRMLAGEETADSGQITLTRGDTVVDEVWRRVAVVHQEPHIWPNMTVEQNLAVGREGRWFGDITPEPVSAKSVLERLGIAGFAHHELADLSLAVQQRVEIARAMLSDADVYLFDEPNSALTEEESEALFATMAELAGSGKIVLLITHRLNDFVRCCQRILVLRDGRIRCEIRGAEISETSIAAQLTPAETAEREALPASARTAPKADGAPLLKLQSCSDRFGAFRDITLDLAPGRVLALSGVEGSGARELAQAMGAFRPFRDRSGQTFTTLDQASVAYLAASRRDTVFRNLSVGDNLASRLAGRSLGRLPPFIDPAKIDALAARAIKRYRVKTGGSHAPITSLSGGNQQKVVLGAAMEQGTDIIVIEEPTRGVDISSKADIYELLRDFAAQGRAVVVFCTEVQEIFDVADDVVVLSHGRIVGRVDMAGIATIPELADLLASYEAV